MKKILSIILTALLSLCTLTGCASNKKCIVKFIGAESVEVISADDGIDVSADANTLIVKASKDGTYTIEFKVDDTETSAEVTKEKSGYTVKTTADYDTAVMVE